VVGLGQLIFPRGPFNFPQRKKGPTSPLGFKGGVPPFLKGPIWGLKRAFPRRGAFPLIGKFLG